MQPDLALNRENSGSDLEATQSSLMQLELAVFRLGLVMASLPHLLNLFSRVHEEKMVLWRECHRILWVLPQWIYDDLWNSCGRAARYTE